MIKPLLTSLLLCALPVLGQAQAVGSSMPERVFESFWQTFRQQYAGFEARHVDWEAIYRTYRPQVAAATTDAALLALLTEMVQPLRDGHVSISKTGDLPASAKYSAFHQRFASKAAVDSLRLVTRHTLAASGFGIFTRFRSKQFQIGGYCQSAAYCYLQLNGFGGMPLAEFERQLDELVASAQPAKAIIIDIRINGGGSPEFVNAVMGRLVRLRRVASFGQRKTGSGPRDFTPLQPYYYEVASRPALAKPVVLLTSGASISAADHFAMGLKGLDFVTIVGENTGGLFSSMLGARLPNGWEFSLSNERYFSRDSICYEAVGVPPDIRSANTRDDLLSDRDTVLLAALDFLKRTLTVK